MKTEIRKENWTPTKELLPLILGKDMSGELEEKEIEKMELFEKGLAKELHKTDTIEQAITKIVKMAVAAEFGASLVAAQGAKDMIATITRGILGDAELRKQALLIVDRFANA
jgi:glucose-6-phosphate-specific signal transduction histidine kinase